MTHASTGRGRKKTHTKFVLIAGIAILAVIFIFWHAHQAQAPSDASTTSTQVGTSSFDKQARSLTNPASLWVIVNKPHPLSPASYVPALVVPDVPLKGGKTAENMHVSPQMAPALVSLFAGAKTAGYSLMLSSGYRSYQYQVGVYNQEVHSKGATGADQESARPGHSEHQTGLAADVAPVSGTCDLSQCFGATPEGKWLAANAYKYGFIIRYPADKVAVTGYEYEPWHIRYVGTTLSMQLHKQGIETLEEFFHVSGGPNY